MNVSQWPMGKIMQLPDWCFGARWPVAEALSMAGTSEDFVISQDGLPERCVIWMVWVTASATTWAPFDAEFRLGDQLPANLAAFRLFEPLFGPLGDVGNIRSVLLSGAFGTAGKVFMRKPVVTMGRRLVLRLGNRGSAIARAQAGIIVSSVPTEVPDWLVCR